MHDGTYDEYMTNPPQCKNIKYLTYVSPYQHFRLPNTRQVNITTRKNTYYTRVTNE